MIDTETTSLRFRSVPSFIRTLFGKVFHPNVGALTGDAMLVPFQGHQPILVPFQGHQHGGPKVR